MSGALPWQLLYCDGQCQGSGAVPASEASARTKHLLKDGFWKVPVGLFSIVLLPVKSVLRLRPIFIG
jgi:hypothetical protein